MQIQDSEALLRFWDVTVGLAMRDLKADDIIDSLFCCVALSLSSSESESNSR